MSKYRVTADAIATIYLGIFEAETEEEAIEMAFDKQGTDQITLCWHCSRKVGELILVEDTVAAEKMD